MLRALWVALFLCLFSSFIFAAEPPRVPLAEVLKHVDKEAAVELTIASTHMLETGKFCFLNSKKNFMDQDNFTIVIDETGLAKFAEQGIKSPSEYFRGKLVQVNGKITLRKDRPQIVVQKPEQIAIVIELKPKK